jgi:GH25 family lysozyme M1 (1,4-beta-N-acetylmuramidase)
MKTNGIDVSRHQGTIEWDKVKKAGVQFAILRAGYGKLVSQKDKSFETNYAACKKHKIPVGAYWYSYATTAEDAKKEAAACIEVIKGKQFEYPIYFDIEDDTQTKLGKTKCTAIVKAFCDALEKAGYWVGVYSFKAFLEANISKEVRERYAVWVAHTGVKETTYSGQFAMWQHSHTGDVDGIKGDVDMNECYYDYPKAIKTKGKNGYAAEEKPVVVPEPVKPEPVKPPKEEAAKPTYIKYVVKRGDTLWDIAHKYLGKGNRYREIMYASGITSEKIYPKQVLLIPKK